MRQCAGFMLLDFVILKPVIVKDVGILSRGDGCNSKIMCAILVEVIVWVMLTLLSFMGREYGDFEFC